MKFENPEMNVLVLTTEETTTGTGDTSKVVPEPEN